MLHRLVLLVHDDEEHDGDEDGHGGGAMGEELELNYESDVWKRHVGGAAAVVGFASGILFVSPSHSVLVLFSPFLFFPPPRDLACCYGILPCLSIVRWS